MSRQKVVETASAQIGTKGRPNKFTKWYGSIGGTTSYAWCVVFIGWCFKEAGLNIFPKTASVIQVLDHAKANGTFKSKSSGYTPQAGDIMLQQSGGASHVGIVTGTANGCFYTIEGNYSDSVSKVTRSYDAKLTGFFVPPYTNTSATQEKQAEYKDSESKLPKNPTLIDNVKTEEVSLKEDFFKEYEESYAVLADGINITKYIGGLSWKNSFLEIATTMSFETAKTDMKYMNLYQPTVGSIINFYTFEEIFRGIILSVDDSSEYVNRYTAVDFGWYLNKSKETYQFNNMPAGKAINKLCSDFNIAVDSIPPLEREISKIYFENTISEIISDILDMCYGTDSYNYHVTPKGIKIYKVGDITAFPQFQLSSNTHPIDSVSVYGGKDHSLSISDMKNSIKVISEKDEVVTVKAVFRDNESITKFGLLQDIIKIDPEKENPQTAGNQALNERNRIAETFSIEIIESHDSYTRAGSVIIINDVFYVIDSSSHTISNDIHKVKLEVIRL